VRRYKLVRRIGVGERSQVFEADDLRTGRRVALKCPREGRRDSTLMESLRDEAAALRTSRSGLVVVVEQDYALGDSHIVMALAKGSSLARHLELWGAVDLELGIRVGVNLCHVVRRSREEGFEVSRIKPTDVLIDRTRRLYGLPEMTVVGLEARRLATGERQTWSAELKAVASLVRTIALSEASLGNGEPSVATALRRVLDIAEGREPSLYYPTVNGLLHGLLRARQGQAPK